MDMGLCHNSIYVRMHFVVRCYVTACSKEAPLWKIKLKLEYHWIKNLQCFYCFLLILRLTFLFKILRGVRKTYEINAY